jgi:hypothetical protein
MISVENLQDAQAQWARGNRTFRIVHDQADIQPNEMRCLADGAGKQCIDCGLCNGRSKSMKSIVILAHGSGKSFV